MSPATRSGRDFHVVPAAAEDKNAVFEFLLKFFFRDEPLNSAAELMKDNSLVGDLRTHIMTILQNNGLAFKAISPDGKLMGVILSGVMYKNGTEEHDESDADQKVTTRFSKIETLLEKVERETDVFTKYPNADRIMDIKIVSVDQSFRGQGVCTALMNKTIELAVEKGYPMVYVECSSYFSAKAAEKLGFKCIYTLYFRDYTDENGKEIFKTIPPHDSSKVYVLTL